MIDIENIRTKAVKGLHDYLKVLVIRSNQTNPVPPYPYLTYTITTLSSENKGTWGKYEDGIDRKPIYQTWSITTHSDDMEEAENLAVKAREWLDYVGVIELSDNNIVVQSASGITNRDNLLTAEYEYKSGFDVVFSLMQEVENRTEKTGYIEIAPIERVFKED